MNSQLSEKDYQIITELKKLLISNNETLIEQILCYGSRVYAQKEDTDFDILIITQRKISWQEEMIILGDIYKFGLEKDIQFDAKFFSSEKLNYFYSQMPFIKNVLSYGIVV